MARKNRVQVPDGTYHVTMRVAHREMLLADDAFKDFIVEQMRGAAEYSGVDLLGFCVMNNHVHMFVRVPRVPERLWLDANTEPASTAFGMRPPECRVQLWQAEGTVPRKQAPLDFMLDDAEMLGRLTALYGAKSAAATGKRWERLRSRGRGDEVDREKANHCRRMYNLSQFVKTVAETVSRRYNAETGHEGCFWQGRFYSGVVERKACVQAIVAAYIDYNAVRANLVASPDQWRWCGFAAACNGDVKAQAMYESILGVSWPEARRRMESIFADSLPEDLDEILTALTKGTAIPGGDSPRENSSEGDSPRDNDTSDGDSPRKNPLLRAAQVIRLPLWIMSKGGYIGLDMSFGRRVASQLPAGFPRKGFRSLLHCLRLDWDLAHVPTATTA